jgi:hypothetical protein
MPTSSPHRRHCQATPSAIASLVARAGLVRAASTRRCYGPVPPPLPPLDLLAPSSFKASTFEYPLHLADASGPRLQPGSLWPSGSDHTALDTPQCQHDSTGEASARRTLNLPGPFSHSTSVRPHPRYCSGRHSSTAVAESRRGSTGPPRPHRPGGHLRRRGERTRPTHREKTPYRFNGTKQCNKREAAKTGAGPGPAEGREHRANSAGARFHGDEARRRYRSEN